MVAVKPRDQERFLQDPPENVRLFLIYGPDNGLAVQRCRSLEQHLSSLDPAGGTIITLTSDDLSADPARLATEAYSTSLFGGMPIIRLTLADSRKSITGALTPLLDNPPDDAFIVIEAGDLKPSSHLRKAFEKNPAAASLACYEPSHADMTRLVERKLAAEDLKIDTDALEFVVASLGSNRMLATNEINKLILFAASSERVTLDDAIDIIGESAELRFDRLIDNATLGHAEALDADLNRIKSELLSPSALLSQMLRHLMLLAKLRQSIDNGAALSQAVEKARPPIFFKRKPQVQSALRIWSQESLAKARSGVSDAILASRRQPQLDYPICFQALHRVAAMARFLNRTS